MHSKSKYLNCGCGSRFDPSWENVDFISQYPEVKQYNLANGIPYEDNSFEVVYHSHVLEHFSKRDGELFLRECFRVLEKDGILRVAVPDLETLAKCYLENLRNVLLNDTDINKANYDWSVIELFDQVVRSRSGGEMQEYWERKEIINESLLIDRLGFEFMDFRKRISEANLIRGEDGKTVRSRARFFHPVRLIKEKIKQKVLKPYQAYIDLGKFRLSGEVHQWMYDRYSLVTMLKNLGFREVAVVSPHESRIPNWEKYSFLDIEEGKTRKPDSLFVEGIK